MTVIIKILQLLIAMGLLIFVHELGHFTFSKMFGIRVEKFFLFFDARGIKLFSTRSGWFTRLFPKAKEWETEYGIGWLPLGGYCKISGMIDESMDTGYLKTEPKPWEFRTKPAWQRLLVMAGGVLFNFIFAILMYIVLLAGWGESYVRNEGSSIYVNELAHDMGFRNGDHIISFDDYIPENFFMLQADMARNTASKATVLRNGDTLDIYIDHNRIGDVLNTPGMFDLARPFTINGIAENSVNIGADLVEGDRIIAINGNHVEFVQDAWPLMAELAGQNVSTQVLRGADTLNMGLQIDTTGMMGVYLTQPAVVTKEYSLLSAIPAGFAKTFSSIGGYIKDLKLVFTPSTEAYKSVGSFIAIGEIMPPTWDWYSFMNILAMLSIILGVMNLIPIPALDGGHIAFTLYEMVTGRKPSDTFLAIMQIIGMILIFGLMFLAFGNDIARLLR